jgi:hypothetical protein
MVDQSSQHSTLRWRTSTASGGDGACVEVAQSDTFVLVRDSCNRSGVILEFTLAQWRGLVRRTKDLQEASHD